eukprot:Polyplicarium_translucidae@DN2581_c0_g1_i2.p4
MRDSKEAILRGQRDQHQLMLDHQDDQLDDLARSAETLNRTALVINHELEDHQRMLSELDRDVETQTGRMKIVMDRISQVLKTSDTKQLCLILWLFVIFLVMLLLVIYF